MGTSVEWKNPCERNANPNQRHSIIKSSENKIESLSIVCQLYSQCARVTRSVCAFSENPLIRFAFNTKTKPNSTFDSRKCKYWIRDFPVRDTSRVRQIRKRRRRERRFSRFFFFVGGGGRVCGRACVSARRVCVCESHLLHNTTDSS